MRMLNDINATLAVDEVITLDGTPVWKPGSDTSGAPDFFMITAQYAYADDEVELGEYNMDGTIETYRKAVKDFNRVCMKAAKEGYFCLTDFQDCEIF